MPDLLARRPSPLLLALLLAGLPSPGHPAEDVWLDVDTSIGLPRGEVDDGLALIQAFHSPELAIRGVSVVFGNTTLEQAVPIARDLVERFGPPGLEVWPGAASSEERGEETEAVAALARALQERELTVLALGPVTNVATLVELYPELHGRIRSIVTVAARRPGQKFLTGRGELPHRDFNFELDPEGMATLLQSDIPLVFAPWEVSSKVWIREADLKRLANASESGRWIAKACASWLELWEERFGVDGFNPFDTLAVGWVTHPHLLTALEVGVWIEEGEDDREEGAVKPYLLVDPDRSGVRRALYAYEPQPPFRDLLLERLASRP